MFDVKLSVLRKLFQDTALGSALNPTFTSIIVGLVANITASRNSHKINYSWLDEGAIPRVDDLSCDWMLFRALLF